MKTSAGDSLDWKGYTCTPSSCIVSLCSNPNQCVWEATTTSVPSPLEDFHPYYNMDFYGTDNDTLCLPKNPTDTTDTTCLDKTSQNDCSDDSCTWTQILPYFNTYPSATQTLLLNWQQKNGKSPFGYYCGDGTDGSFMRLEQVSGNNNCIWTDCVTRISNPGTTQVEWDSSSNKCSALIGALDGGIGSSVTCTGKGEPCSLCIDIGQQVDCFKCSTSDTCDICTNKTGKYVPSSECKSTNWEFKKCVDPITNSNDTIYPEVLNYSCNDCSGETCTTTNNGYYCGNCPWGGNNSSDTKDYIINSDNNKQVYGQANDAKVCSNNNQFIVDPKTTTYYSSQQSKSSHGPVCLIDSSCTESTDKCFPLQSQCEQAHPTCDNDNGWFLNSDHNDCNIFACTNDGSLMNTNTPDKNADNIFHFYEGNCWRLDSGINPNSNDRCRWAGNFLHPETCTGDIPQCSNVTSSWGNCTCNSDVPYHCSGTIDDQAPAINGAAGGPIYYYPDSDGLTTWFYPAKVMTTYVYDHGFNGGYPQYGKITPNG